MSSAGILEIVVPERALSTLEVPTPEIPRIATEPAVAPQEQEEESHTRPLLIGGFILGATMLSAMGGTLLIWAYLR